MEMSRYAARLIEEKIDNSTGKLKGEEVRMGGLRAPGKFGSSSVMIADRFSNLPPEPEDARLTGGTRSLSRRLLALNVEGSISHAQPYKSVTAA